MVLSRILEHSILGFINLLGLQHAWKRLYGPSSTMVKFATFREANSEYKGRRSLTFKLTVHMLNSWLDHNTTFTSDITAWASSRINKRLSSFSGAFIKVIQPTCPKIRGDKKPRKLRLSNHAKSEFEKVNPFSAGIIFIRQNLAFVDVRFWRIKMIPAQ